MAVSTFDETEVRKAIAQLKPNGELFEIRILQDKRTLSGYFRDADSLISALRTVDMRNANAYITLNAIDDSLFSRQQSNKFLASKQTTNDKDVLGYEWLFIDFDPVRAAGISSTDDELKKAFALAKKVGTYLKQFGFEDPVKAVSGNGAHLLYRIGLKLTDENKRLVENVLKALSLMFDTDDVKVDAANFNPSRICKLYGTLAQKGANTPERPHRWSHMLEDVKEVRQTDKAYLEKLAAQLPAEVDAPKPARYNNYSPREFDIESWMSEHGLTVNRIDEWNGCTKYVLDRCPFDNNHKAPDSMILKQPNGAIGFKCLHNSCQGKTWQDVRLMFDPDAYERKAINDEELEMGYRRHKANRDAAVPKVDPIDVPDEPAFYTVEDIVNKPDETEEFIKTGIEILDKKIRGLAKGKVSLLTGLRGSAKSTLINNIILSARQQGYNSICYSGELTNKNFVRWLTLQAAGRNHVVESSQYEGYYYVKPEVKPKITEWLGDHVMLYNNDYGNNFVRLHELLVEWISKTKADLVILDNLMALNIMDLSRDKYEAQTAFVNVLCDLAKKTNTHIMFVAHPRKANGFLRLDDVSGSGDLSNRVDYAFVIHRNNNDFKRLSMDMFNFKETDAMYQGTNVMEVVKDRDGGTQDLFIPLWYETESKRLKNSAAEMVVYGWDSEPLSGFAGIDDAQEEFPF